MKITGEEKHYKKLNLRLSKELNDIKPLMEKTLERMNRLEHELIDINEQKTLLEEENNFLKSKMNLSDKEVRSLLTGLELLKTMTSLSTIKGEMYNELLRKI